MIDELKLKQWIKYISQRELQDWQKTVLMNFLKSQLENADVGEGEKMTGICPYECDNKTEYGYCKTTGCINPKYQYIIALSYNNNTFPSPCAKCRNNPANGGSGVCHCVLGVNTFY